MTAEVGDIRIRWESLVCLGKITVLAQQIENEGIFTFRKWNPDQVYAPIGEIIEDGGTEIEEEIDVYLGIKKLAIDKVYNREKDYDKILKEIQTEHPSQGVFYALILFILFLVNFFGQLQIFCG